MNIKDKTDENYIDFDEACKLNKITLIGEDFDGVKSNRAVAGVFLALELAQIGKFAKAIKSGKYVKYGEKYVVNSAKKFINFLYKY